MAIPQNPRIQRELDKIHRNPPPGISVTPKNDDIRNLEATILGPENTPYEEGTFYAQVTLPPNYPFAPPSIKFSTRVYHPNIDDQGRICLDLLKLPPKGTWNPTMTIEGLLIAVRMLLECPNPTDPLMGDIAQEYIRDRKVFEQNAKEHTKIYAVKNLE